MYHHLYKYLEKFKIFYPLQFGFRELYAPISISESIRQSIDNNEFGCGKLIDLKKAFNTVNLRILLTKLNHYAIRGSALEWFESYIYPTDCKTYVLMVISQFLSQLLVVFHKDHSWTPFILTICKRPPKLLKPTNI